MGCLGSILQFFFWLIVVNFAWNFLIAPLVGAKPSPQRTATNKTRFLRLLMPLLAKIAKADGRVSEHEIDRVESIFRTLELSPEERRYAAQIFSESKDTPEEFDAAAAAFAMNVSSFELRTITFQFLVLVASADGTVSAAERAMLIRAATRFRTRRPPPAPKTSRSSDSLRTPRTTTSARPTVRRSRNSTPTVSRPKASPRPCSSKPPSAWPPSMPPTPASSISKVPA